jgi:hypothetical protein
MATWSGIGQSALTTGLVVVPVETVGIVGKNAEPAVRDVRAVGVRRRRENRIQVVSAFFHVPSEVQQLADEHFPDGQGIGGLCPAFAGVASRKGARRFQARWGQSSGDPVRISEAEGPSVRAIGSAFLPA